MKRELHARVGADGVLNLTVPLRLEGANKTVRVVVETVEAEAPAPTPPADREAWLRFIAATAGRITDPTFERPPQGEYEQRDEWP